jgi:predicted dehydrogenase
MADSAPLRIGVLGAARITPMALLRPARHVPEAAILAVAARAPERAQKFAHKHGIARVHPSYDALLADPEIDAVYNPLPNSLHCEWTIRALEAGKHVLCEKPIAANAAEAERMAGGAQRTGRVLVEAFHWRYHPLAARMRAIIDSGELGAVRHVEAHLCIPLLLPGDIRYRLDLAGGATMDTGCYTISIIRFLAGAEPDVVRAAARLSSPGVDRAMAADFRFPDGCTGRITCSLLSPALLRVSAHVRGERGEMAVFNPIGPQILNWITVRTAAGKRRERIAGDATYTYQLRAFVGAVRRGEPVPTGPDNAIANMRVIDAVYRAAGLQPRGAVS